MFLRAAWKFRGYRPQPITYGSLSAWIKQFGEKDRKTVLKLLDKIIFISEAETKKRLLDLNKTLIDRLIAADISLDKIIYVQIDDAGSSSPVMLNILKEGARLERKRCRFVDSRDVRSLVRLSDELGEGAIIYVDDFIGTGTQLCTARDFAVEHMVGNFAEFVLSPCICEEAIIELGKRGIEPVAAEVHSKAVRPLHQHSSILNDVTKKQLIDICHVIDRKGGLGYKKMATMVVLYRNAPNTVPVIFRGNVGQQPYIGIFPRYQDLPPFEEG